MHYFNNFHVLVSCCKSGKIFYVICPWYFWRALSLSQFRVQRNKKQFMLTTVWRTDFFIFVFVLFFSFCVVILKGCVCEIWDILKRSSWQRHLLIEERDGTTNKLSAVWVFFSKTCFKQVYSLWDRTGYLKPEIVEKLLWLI